MTAPSRRALADRLRPAAGEAAAIEARWLLEETSDLRDLELMVARRLGGEPIDRILGRRGFWTLDLKVGPHVLSPRSDTETIVRAALDHAPSATRVLDLGTGSGAILLAVLSELPGASGLGVDASDAAVAGARENAQRTGLDGRAMFVQGGWRTACGDRFDLVVSNPPYVPSAEIAALDPEVREHDPRLALDGGPDGLACYREIVPLLAGLLAPCGVAVLEIGVGQGDAVSGLAATAGLHVGEIRPDLGGVPRAMVLLRADEGRG